MAPAPVKCPVTTCEYRTPANLPTYDTIYRDLDLHTRYAHYDLQVAQPQQQHHPGGGGGGGVPKPDRLPRPTIGEGSTDSDWVYFTDQWERYKRSTKLDGQNAVDQLWACCSEELARAVYDSGVKNNADEGTLISAIRKLSVRAQNKLVNVVTFLGLAQDRDETIGSFCARLRGQATVCNFETDCSSSTCTNKTNYMNEMVAHQLVRGLNDVEMQEQIMGHAATTSDLDLAGITKFLEAKETGKRSTGLITAAAAGGFNRLSDYKSRDRANTLPPTLKTRSEDLSGKCDYCGLTGHGRRSTKEVRKVSCKAYTVTCRKCNKLGHYEAVCKSRAPTDQTGAQNNMTVGTFCSLQVCTKKGREVRALPHHVYDRYAGWVARPPAPHPLTQVSISLCTSGYRELELPLPRVVDKSITRMSMADTGAQMLVGGVDIIHSLGLTKKDLIPLATEVNAANRQSMGLLGGVLITITGKDRDGNIRETRQLCYISSLVHTLFLSEQACEDLGIIEESFPRVGTFQLPGNLSSSGSVSPQHTAAQRPCSCPPRTAPPPPPTALPMPAVPENREKLQKWIEDKYASSAFNQCCHQELPLVTGLPPLRLHVDPDKTPVATHTPISIPIHWQKQVKEELDRDCRLGVLEPVPLDEPVSWCSRMVICPKQDGSPRRTVDLQALNKAAVRQTHPTDTPFHLAAAIPKNSIKSTLDCWNGYHSIPLAPEDRPKTTFVTQWGLYRYRVAPQGFLAAGDAYTARFDAIAAGITNRKQCVDDTCLYSNSLEENFNLVCKFLSLCAGAGMVFNKKKTQFGLMEVEFLGFKVTADSVKPSSKYLAAIRDFPRPRDITGIRSWYGLINQVNFAFSKSDIMLPFRELLKPSTDFKWTDELQEAFEKSKEEIIKAVEDGVKTFDMSKITCLATDWSKTGLGFCLLQKNCNCKEITPICCSTGWSLVFAGSRFTSGAESRYSPVEGEALSVVWSLEKAKHFILGCPTLYVAVDHKPLLGLLGDRHLEDIPNPRLQNLKEKTFRYRYKLVHVPGSKHSVPDAASRHPTGAGEHMELANMAACSQERLSKVFLEGLRSQPMEEDTLSSQDAEQTMTGLAMSSLSSLTLAVTDEPSPPTMATLNSNSTDRQAITWDRLKAESARDPTISSLVSLITSGIPEDKALWPEGTREYHKLRSELSSTGPVALFRERVIMPAALQSETLEILHSAHQGTAGMTARAASSVYWPGMTADISRKRAACTSCDKNTPSQPSAPPTPLPQPAYPFEMICSDYFSLHGKKFLIVVDRYSGWLSVYSVTMGDGARGLIQTLKTHFSTFGISEQLASDRGPEYIAEVTKKFLKDWGVEQRLSSSYFPHSNQRAELGVKSAKRMLRENVSPSGHLNTDKFLRALLNHRNTPDRDTGLSPAQVIFGHPIRDFLPVKPGRYKPRQEWMMTMEKREQALARRHARQEQLLSEHTKTLPPLKVSDVVSIQNQHGPHPLKWDKSGTVVEVMQYDQYKIRMDGSGRASIRNRKFLKKIVPFNSVTRTGHSLHPEQTPPIGWSARDNLHHSPGLPTQGQAGEDHLSHVPDEQIELDHTPHVPDGPAEGSHAQHAPDAAHEDVLHPPDAVITRQPSNDDQSAAPPPAQRPTRDRRMPGRFEDYIMNNITNDFNRYNVTQVPPAELSGLSPGRR